MDHCTLLSRQVWPPEGVTHDLKQEFLGFCGSLTTFSSWQLDVFNSWINAGNFHRSGFHSASLVFFEIGAVLEFSPDR